MLIKCSSALLLASLGRVTAPATVLQCWTSRVVPLNGGRSLTRDGALCSDSTGLSSATSDPAEKKSSPGNTLTAPGPGAGLDPDLALPIVQYDTPKGRVRRNIRVSAKTNAGKLVAAVAPLLNAHTSKLVSTKSVGSNGWQLQPEGDTIVRFFAFDSEADATKFVASVRTAADEMDHHPEIATSVPQTTHTKSVTCVAVSCSTHRPPGLSMRDVRLARKVDELAEPFNYMASNTDIALRTALRAIRKSLLHQLQSQKVRGMTTS